MMAFFSRASSSSCLYKFLRSTTLASSSSSSSFPTQTLLPSCFSFSSKSLVRPSLITIPKSTFFSKSQSTQADPSSTSSSPSTTQPKANASDPSSNHASTSSTEQEATHKNEANSSSFSSSSSNDPKSLTEQLNKMSLELKEKTEKLNVVVSNYHRALADAENLRARTKKEIEQAHLFSLQSFAKELLTTADTLALALNSISKSSELHSNPSLQTLLEGLTMTNDVFHSTLHRFGVKRMDVVEGDVFQPHHHHALFEVPMSMLKSSSSSSSSSSTSTSSQADATNPSSQTQATEVDQTQSQQPSSSSSSSASSTTSAPRENHLGVGVPGTIQQVVKSGYFLHDRVLRPAQVGVVKECEETEEQKRKETVVIGETKN